MRVHADENKLEKDDFVYDVPTKNDFEAEIPNLLVDVSVDD